MKLVNNIGKLIILLLIRSFNYKINMLKMKTQCFNCILYANFMKAAQCGVKSRAPGTILPRCAQVPAPPLPSEAS